MPTVLVCGALLVAVTFIIIITLGSKVKPDTVR